MNKLIIVRQFKFFQKNTYRSRFPSPYGEDIDYLIDNIPQYIIASGEIGAYREGILAGINRNINNPYHDTLRGEIWNRGFWDAQETINRR